jgi:transposase
MQDATRIELIRSKYIALAADLDERGRRRWAAVEARALGHGGITTVATAIGMSDRTIRTGLKELDELEPLSSDRQRRAGAGRKSYRLEQPGLVAALDRMIGPTTRGSPMSPLRWTCKSTRALAAALVAQGFTVSASRVRRLLAEMGYSLQANRKTREGRQHPDRDGQFRHINGRVLARKRRHEPAISVDTKKKEVLGNHKNFRKSGLRGHAPEGFPLVGVATE